jgi:hypothetical protein
LPHTELSKGTALKFDAHEMDINGLSDLGGALSALEEDRQAVIIRGKSTDALPAFDVHRRQEQFESAPRQWCLIDIDELLIPEKFEDEMANTNNVQNQEVAGLKMLLAQAAYNPYGQALVASLPKIKQKQFTILICP